MLYLNDFNTKVSLCNICRKEYTSVFFEAMPGVKIFTCQDCIKAAKDNFIWICLGCGESYLRPKKLVMKRRNGYSMKEAFLLEETQLIQGIYMCIKCRPAEILGYMKAKEKQPSCMV